MPGTGLCKEDTLFCKKYLINVFIELNSSNLIKPYKNSAILQTIPIYMIWVVNSHEFRNFLFT